MSRALLLVVAGWLASSPLHGGELSAVELATARKLYLSKCAKCHKLHDPLKYPEAEWNDWMGRMAKKSKLKPAQADMLARYIAAGRAGEITLPGR